MPQRLVRRILAAMMFARTLQLLTYAGGQLIPQARKPQGWTRPPKNRTAYRPKCLEARMNRTRQLSYQRSISQLLRQRLSLTVVRWRLAVPAAAVIPHARPTDHGPAMARTLRFQAQQPWCRRQLHSQTQEPSASGRICGTPGS